MQNDEPQYCKHIKFMCCQKKYEQNTAPCWKTCNACPVEEATVGAGAVGVGVVGAGAVGGGTVPDTR